MQVEAIHMSINMYFHKLIEAILKEPTIHVRQVEAIQMSTNIFL